MSHEISLACCFKCLWNKTSGSLGFLPPYSLSFKLTNIDWWTPGLILSKLGWVISMSPRVLRIFLKPFNFESYHIPFKSHDIWKKIFAKGYLPLAKHYSSNHLVTTSFGRLICLLGKLSHFSACTNNTFHWYFW